MRADIPAAIEDDACDADGAGIARRIASGGDDRIAVDPASGRNAYGTAPVPRPGCIQFSSSTASTVGVRGWQAVGEIERTLGQGGRWSDSGIAALCGSVRSRLQATFGIDGSSVVLAASGTDAELLMLAAAMRTGGGPVTNIVMAPKESGSGVLYACAGRHFRAVTCLGDEARAGDPLAGWEGADIETVTVDIRFPDGMVRDRARLEDEVEALARAALARGRRVVLHVLDTSKTGLRTSTRAAARHVASRAPDRVSVVVDACQLRCDAEQVRADLRDGFAVIVTGSKFAGGPPFSGALLLPPALSRALRDAGPLTDGLRAYTALHDWPRALRGPLGDGLRRHNDGAALRWVAALAEYGSCQAVAPGLAGEIVARFEAGVRERTRTLPFAPLLFAEDDDVARARCIVPVVACDSRGQPLSPSQAKDLHRALRTPLDREDALAREINVGQPVAVGERTALRVCIDAPRIADIAGRIAAGRSPDSAFAETAAELDAVFDKWTALVEGRV